MHSVAEQQLLRQRGTSNRSGNVIMAASPQARCAKYSAGIYAHLTCLGSQLMLSHVVRVCESCACSLRGTY